METALANIRKFNRGSTTVQTIGKTRTPCSAGLLHPTPCTDIEVSNEKIEGAGLLHQIHMDSCSGVFCFLSYTISKILTLNKKVFGNTVLV